MAALEISKATRRIASTYPSLVLFQLARFFLVLATEMQAVSVGWQVYEITKRPLDLGLVGLAQFLPGIVLFLLAGHVADVFDRRKVLISCDVGFGLCFVLLLILTALGTRSVFAIYAVLILLGIVRSFNGPASRAILPHLVREEHFQNSVAWASGIFQLATILGPVLGGVIYAVFHGPFAVYLIASAVTGTAIGLLLRLKITIKPRAKMESSSSSVFEGFRYIWREKLILGAISLDLFAVLLGGAVALLPVYAKEIFQTGPWGLGLLRSAPGVGAGIMAIVIAYRPLRRNVGATMLSCVAAFGFFTVLFGI